MAKKIKLKQKIANYNQQIEQLKVDMQSEDAATKESARTKIKELWKDVSDETQQKSAAKSKAGKWGLVAALTLTAAVIIPITILAFSILGGVLPGTLAMVAGGVGGVGLLTIGTIFVSKAIKANREYKKLKPVRENLDALRLAKNEENVDKETLERQNALNKKFVEANSNSAISQYPNIQYTNKEQSNDNGQVNIDLGAPVLDFDLNGLEAGDSNNYVFRASYKILNSKKKGANKVNLVRVKEKDLDTYVKKLEAIDFDSQKMITSREIASKCNVVMKAQSTNLDNPFEVLSSKDYKDGEEFFADLETLRMQKIKQAKALLKKKQEDEIINV